MSYREHFKVFLLQKTTTSKLEQTVDQLERVVFYVIVSLQDKLRHRIERSSISYALVSMSRITLSSLLTRYKLDLPYSLHSYSTKRHETRCDDCMKARSHTRSRGTAQRFQIGVYQTPLPSLGSPFTSVPTHTHPRLRQIAEQSRHILLTGQPDNRRGRCRYII